MVKLLVGLLKGVVIGGAIGYGAYALSDATGFDNAWLTYGVIGMAVGLLVGRPLWSLIKDKSATTWAGVLKAAFGFGIGCGLYAIISRVWNPSAVNVMVGDRELNIFTWPVTLGGAIGALYGAFVELDDAIGDDKKAAAARELPAGKQPPAKRPPAKS